MKTRQVLETKQFYVEIRDQLKKRSLLQEDYDALKRQLAENPEVGALLVGTGGDQKN